MLWYNMGLILVGKCLDLPHQLDYLFLIVLEKLKKDKEASKQQCAFVDGATEQPSGDS